MINNEETVVKSLLEVKLIDDSSFLKVKETLSRIGVAGRDNKLYQSCHILHKKGKYYVVHFKEMFLLDGKGADFSIHDKIRRNKIASLLEEWELIKIIDEENRIDNSVRINNIKIVPYAEKEHWELITKYDIGGK